MSDPVPGSWHRFRARLGKVWDSDLAYSFRSSPVAIIAGCIAVLALIFGIITLSAPSVVFFPAYSIYFFADRYPALHKLIYPPPPPEPTMP